MRKSRAAKLIVWQQDSADDRIVVQSLIGSRISKLAKRHSSPASHFNANRQIADRLSETEDTVKGAWREELSERERRSCTRRSHTTASPLQGAPLSSMATQTAASR